MTPEELAHCHAVLGVSSGLTPAELERVFMKRNFELIRGRSGAADEANPALEAERARLRAAYEKLAEYLRNQEEAGGVPIPGDIPAGAGRKKPVLPPAHAPKPPPTRLAPPVKPHDLADDEFILFRFDDWRVNTFVPPLLLGLVWLVTVSPLGFFLRGFHVWMHEFGHSTAAWLCGFRATPLPIGWTPIEPVYSPFVYWGLLLLFGTLFVAGAVERKVWPMLAAVALAGLQYYMTWKMPEHRQEFWWGAFGGVGGEFYLSTLLMLAFWVQLPEKFRWGACRYVLFFIGASAFLNIWLRWGEIYRGIEEIPFGSMINGEDDEGGDMNKLIDGYGWSKFQIRRTYHLLGRWCWVALGVMWLLFALRLNRVADWFVGRFSARNE